MTVPSVNAWDARIDGRPITEAEYAASSGRIFTPITNAALAADKDPSP